MKTPIYSREELISIANIYNEVRNSIHKSNHLIIRKGHELNRPTRGIENQLLMFRSYEKSLNGENYGFNRWNNLVPEVYNEVILSDNLLAIGVDLKLNENHEISMKMLNEQIFPEYFLKFKKSNKSSVSLVRDCFENQRIIQRIETHLHAQLKYFLSQNSYTNVIGLIGGAGNGKTDSIGYIIDELKNLGKIDDATTFKNTFLKSIEENNYYGRYTSREICVYVIADATSRLEGLQRFESFDFVLNEFFHDKSINKYLIVCINRGVLNDFVEKSKGSDYSQLIEMLESTSINEAYLNNISNINNLNTDGTEYNIFSYPLDKIRLFDDENRTHEHMTDILKNFEWSDRKLYDHFIQLSGSMSALFNCHELYISRYLTFRDYLDLLYKLYYPIKGSSSWTNHPIFRLWFGLISDKYYSDLIDVLGSQNKFLNDLRSITKYRKANKLEVFIEYFPYHNELINAELLDDISILNVNDIYDGYEIELKHQKGKSYKVKFSNYYYEVLVELLQNINNVYTNSFGTPDKDNKYNSKRALTNLIGELISIMLFEKYGFFKHHNDLIAYQELDFNMFKTKFLKLLKLEENAVAQMRYTIDQNLTSELWSSRNHSSDVVVKSKLTLAISLVSKVNSCRPKIPNIYVEFKALTDSNKFIVEIDFKHFCQIQKYCVSDTGNLYYECVDSGFTIWLNTIKERLFYIGKSSQNIMVAGKSYEVEIGYNSLL